MSKSDQNDDVTFDQLPEQIQQHYEDVYFFGNIQLNEKVAVVQFRTDDRGGLTTDEWLRTTDGWVRELK
jgi:hypothetical protein